MVSMFMILWMSMFFSGVSMMNVLFLVFMVVFKQLLSGGDSDMIFNFWGDLMSINLMLLSVWVLVLMFLSSFKDNLYNNKYFMFYLFLMLFLLFLCFFSLNLMMFYFFFEAVLFPIIMLIFNWGNQPERLQAGTYMLMYTLLGSMPLFVLMLLYGEVTLNYLFLDFWLKGSMGVLFILMMLGFLVKVPMFFVHLWLPKAHVEAPIAGSMILAAVLLKLGVYGIYRFKSFFMFEMMEIGYILVVVSVLGGMNVGIMCLFQTDIKSLIAYSSICHMGVVLGGTMNMNFWGSYGGLLLMLGHGLCSSGLFCLGNMLYERFFTRSVMLLKGMMKIFPGMSLWWFLFSIVNMSAPPSMNIFGEIFLMGSLIKFSLLFIFPLMMISFLSACYSLYMYSYINHGEGWVVWSVKPVLLREYMILLFHFFPLVVWVLKMDCFLNWV
uniref:NADH-ubiquinone oxidoreductase chain 4 n=1 Tax=Ixodes vespertilionis TaxID=59656 RepID=A0A8E5JV54_9ACAR|nr:NADH dehydrogenase subunit 4 [Ixodes vespertilionis]QVD40498.1 NADH dehydrogenase subunit 4 [Ixodes vespertilionis]